MKRSLMAVLASIGLLTAASCGGPDALPAPPDLRGTADPGASYSLASMLIGVPPGAAVAWSVKEGGGGTIDQAGHYTAPPCVSPWTATAYPQTYHVDAAYAGQTVEIPVTVDERLVSIAVSPSSVTLAPGQAQQFAATLTFSCHTATAP